MKALPILLSLLAFCFTPVFGKDAETAGPKVINVSPDDAEKLLKENPKLLVLDVRTADEFAKGHIAGAKNVDFFDDDFAKKVGALDPATPVLVHCGGGGRSTKALPSLKDKKVVYHLNEGFKAWEKAGKPIEGAEKK